MLRTELGADRDKLRFAEAVMDHFGFLISEYRFSCVARESTYVRYESQRVFVDVYHGRASYEIGIEVGLIPTPGTPARKVSLIELAEYFGVDAGELLRCQYTTQAGVAEYVSQLAQFLRVHGEAVFEGSPAAFESMFRTQHRLSEEYLLSIELDRARNGAASAWRSEDYSEVVKQFEPLREYLSPSEVAKLEYCRRHR